MTTNDHTGAGAEGYLDPSAVARTLHRGSASEAKHAQRAESLEAPRVPDEVAEPPAGLGDPGRYLWVQVVAKYVLNVSERAHLEQACRALDSLARLEAEAAAMPVIVPGHAGQPRANPLHGEIRAARAAFTKLIRELRLPDPATARPVRESFTTTRARKAATVRWNREKGRHG